MGAFGGVDNFFFSGLDPFGKALFEEQKELRMEELKLKMRDARKSRNRDLEEEISKEIENLENQRYIPLAFQSFDSFDLGGAYKATTAPVQEFTREATGWMAENKEFDWTEFVVLAKLAGYGQADISRLVRVIESSQNEVFEKRQNEKEREDKKGTVGDKFQAPEFDFK